MTAAKRQKPNWTHGEQQYRQPGGGELQAMENRLQQRLFVLSERLTELRVIVAGGDGPSLSARMARLETQMLIAVGAQRTTARFATAAATLLGALVGVATLLLKGGV